MPTRILIVEDDPMMTRIYEKVFSVEGFQVTTAPNGQDALDTAREDPPDIIIMDVMMPKLNGLDALKQLKADPKTKSIPVIMLTNLAGEQDADNALAKGALKYLIKSEHTPQDIVDIVRQTLSELAHPSKTPPA